MWLPFDATDDPRDATASLMRPADLENYREALRRHFDIDDDDELDDWIFTDFIGDEHGATLADMLGVGVVDMWETICGRCEDSKRAVALPDRHDPRLADLLAHLELDDDPEGHDPDIVIAVSAAADADTGWIHVHYVHDPDRERHCVIVGPEYLDACGTAVRLYELAEAFKGRPGDDVHDYSWRVSEAARALTVAVDAIDEGATLLPAVRGFALSDAERLVIDDGTAALEARARALRTDEAVA